MTAEHPSDASERRARRMVALLVFAVVAYFIPGASWSPVSRYCLTRAVVERGTFEITPCAPATGDRAVIGDRFYSDKAPLPSFAAVPAYAAFYAIAKLRHRLPAFHASGTPDRPAEHVVVSRAFRNGLYFSSMSTSGISAAALALVLFDVLRRRVGKGSAALGAVTSVVGTPLFPYATSFFGHTTAAALLFGAFAAVDPRGAPRTTARTVVAGVLLGASTGTEYVTAVPAALIAAMALRDVARDRRLKAGLALGIGILVPLSVVFVYQAICFGSPFRTGYSFVVHPAFAAGQHAGLFGITFVRPEALFGILFGRSRGLFYVSPIALVGVIAGIRTFRTDRDPALVTGGLVFGALALLNASYYLWDGGRAFGPRHLVPALGFVGVGIGHAFERFRTIASVAAGFSIAVVIAATAVSLEVPQGTDVVFGYVVPALRRGTVAVISGASNLGLLAGFGPRASILPPLVALAAGVGWISTAWPRSATGSVPPTR